VISVWFEKKRGQVVKIVVPSPLYGHNARLLASCLKALDIPALDRSAEVYFNEKDSPDELLSLLIESYDKFGYFNWENFDERQADIDKIKLNEEIINDAYPEPKQKPIVTPALLKVVTPKPAKVVAPKVVKTKVKKEKVEDDLSFLDDLDNLF
jgi:hypothetical protein